MIHWLSTRDETPARGYWDQTLLEDTLAEFDHGYREVVIIPGAYQGDHIEEINRRINEFAAVLVVITSDEENKFPVAKLEHADMVIYKTYPGPNDPPNVKYLPIGYTPATRPALAELGNMEKTDNWFFAGQVTHPSRRTMAAQLRKRRDGYLKATDGFAKGFKPELYFRYLAQSKVVPAPGGPVNADSFRFYEALEAGAVPIPQHLEFVERLHGPVPFPVLDNWEHINQTINDLVHAYPRINNLASAWWQQRKREIVYQFRDDLLIQPDEITVIIPTSPIPSHPDTAIIEATIRSVRQQLPKAEIVLMIDGIRPEQDHYSSNYHEYVRRLLWKTNHEMTGIFPIVFETHHHQAAMTMTALEHVRTPAVLFVEHDTPIDGDIPWMNMMWALEDFDVIRLLHEAHILPDYKHLMMDEQPQTWHDIPLVRTTQWSQRPHLASTEYYRRIIHEHFSPESRTMIEDKMHSVAQVEDWENNRIAIYAPPGDMKRSLHLDGRKDDPKFEMVF